MGWVNFIVVPKWKLAFEVSRNIDEDIEANYFEEELGCDIYKPLKDLTLVDITNLVEYYKKTPNVSCNDEYLLLWIKSLVDVDYYIMSEHKFIESEYKNYTIII